MILWLSTTYRLFYTDRICTTKRSKASYERGVKDTPSQIVWSQEDYRCCTQHISKPRGYDEGGRNSGRAAASAWSCEAVRSRQHLLRRCTSAHRTSFNLRLLVSLQPAFGR